MCNERARAIWARVCVLARSRLMQDAFDVHALLKRVKRDGLVLVPRCNVLVDKHTMPVHAYASLRKWTVGDVCAFAQQRASIIDALNWFAERLASQTADRACALVNGSDRRMIEREICTGTTEAYRKHMSPMHAKLITKWDMHTMRRRYANQLYTLAQQTGADAPLAEYMYAGIRENDATILCTTARKRLHTIIAVGAPNHE
jgi:hypothetical protein